MNGIDPQLKSVLTSLAMTGSTAVTTWGATHGLVPQADVASVSNALVTLGFAAVTAALAWWKARQVSPSAVIAQVNAQDNGVKVVAATPANVSAPVVNVPLKGTK